MKDGPGRGANEYATSGLAQKLPISRWQRDLTDSTALRNIGPGLAYSLIAYQATIKGLKKLDLDESRLEEDLSESWEVLAEPIQTLQTCIIMQNPITFCFDLFLHKGVSFGVHCMPGAECTGNIVG